MPHSLQRAVRDIGDVIGRFGACEFRGIVYGLIFPPGFISGAGRLTIGKNSVRVSGGNCMTSLRAGWLASIQLNGGRCPISVIDPSVCS